MSYLETAQASRTSFNANRSLRDGKANVGAKSQLLPAQVEPFKKLAARLVDYTDSENAAAKLIGISRGTLRQLLHGGKLTSATGHKILAAYRRVKHHL